jgi:hypothetical protein
MIEEECKEPSMICNESLQIPKSFPFSAESNFTKNANYPSEPIKPVATVGQKFPSSLIKMPTSRIAAQTQEEIPEHPSILRRVEMPLVQYETPKRQKHHISHAQMPQYQYGGGQSRRVNNAYLTI